MEKENKMKKILFVVPSLVVGGMERMQVTLANVLYAAGYDITIMTLNPTHTLASELNEGIKLIYKPYREFPIMSKIKYLWTFYDDGIWETRSSSRTLHNYYVGNEHYDVEIAFFRGLPIKIVAGAKKNVVKLAWVHNDFQKASGYQNNFSSMQQVFDAYKRFDKVVCVSNQAQSGFRKVIGDTGNLTTIYNLLPVDEIERKAQESPEVGVRKASLHLVLVGRLLDSAKGQKRLIDAVARLHDEGKDVSLALIGGGNDEQMLRTEITDKRAEHYITMCGNQMNPYPYIKEADLLVCASYFEGYNLTVAEALILGIPVLSTNCTGPNEILDNGKYGKIVENSEYGLYQGIKEVTENPVLLEEYRNKAISRREFFDESQLLKQITDLFEREQKKYA